MSANEGPTVGVDIGGTKMLLLARWPAGSGLDELRLDTGPGTEPRQLEQHIRAFAASLAARPTAIGIAVPGLVDVDAGRVEISDVLPNLGGWRPAGLLGPDVPQVVVNDVRAALAETSRTLPPRATAAILVAGTAIGMAWMAEGQVVNGTNGWAGEIGSMPVPTGDGIRRLDELAGGAAIVAATGLAPADIHRALANRDQRVEVAVHNAGESLGLAIATVVNLLNPAVVTLAGGALAYSGYLEAALAAAQRTALPELWRACEIQRSADEPRVVALGAAYLAEQAATAA